jgi:hypothetical protein
MKRPRQTLQFEKPHQVLQEGLETWKKKRGMESSSRMMITGKMMMMT